MGPCCCPLLCSELGPLTPDYRHLAGTGCSALDQPTVLYLTQATVFLTRCTTCHVPFVRCWLGPLTWPRSPPCSPRVFSPALTRGPRDSPSAAPACLSRCAGRRGPRLPRWTWPGPAADIESSGRRPPGTRGQTSGRGVEAQPPGIVTSLWMAWTFEWLQHLQRHDKSVRCHDDTVIITIIIMQSGVTSRWWTSDIEWLLTDNWTGQSITLQYAAIII